MEEDERGIFSKALDRKPLLLLKIKIERNLDCPIKEYNAIFNHIVIISGPISGVKKSALNNY